MRIVTIVAIGIAWGTPLAGQVQDTASLRSAVDLKVRELVTRTNFDVLGTMPLYVRSPEVTSINNQTIIRGWDQLDAQTRAGAGNQGNYFIRAGAVSVAALGSDHALAVAPFSMQVRNGTTFVDLNGSMSLVYRRLEDQWLLLHEHYSLGADPNALQKLASQVQSLHAQLSASGSAQPLPGQAANQSNAIMELAKMFLAASGGGSIPLALQVAEWLLAPPKPQRR